MSQSDKDSESAFEAWWQEWRKANLYPNTPRMRDAARAVYVAIAFSGPDLAVEMLRQQGHLEEGRRTMRERIAATDEPAIIGAGCAVSSTVPNGWKLVPVQPTDDMVQAGVTAAYESADGTRGVIREAILAAPVAPVSATLPPEANELAGMARDARRYRWLRDKSVPPHNFYISVPVEFKDERYTAQQVDAAIDAALGTSDDGAEKP